MGNTLTQLDPKKAKKFDTYLSKCPKLLNKELLTDNKLFKTYSFLVEGESAIIMKVYMKRGEIDFKGYEISLREMQTRFDLNLYPNLLPYTRLIDEQGFAALIRPKAYLTLNQRLLTVPLLRRIEKLWVIFQAITGLYNLHSMDLYHGNISSSNLVLTTWNHVFLTDFCWYAPNYLQEDKLDDKNYFYPTASRKCNLAPEKFIPKDDKETLSKIQMNQEDIKKILPETLKKLQKMDIFSIGCVIAEIMLDGTSLFSYEQLLAYRRNEYDPTPILEKIKDEDIRKLIQDMIKRNPEERPTLKVVLQKFCREISPSSFSSILYYIDAALVGHNFILPDQRVALIRELIEPIYTEVLQEKETTPHFEPLPLPIQQCHILNLFLKYYGNTKPDFSELLEVERLEFFTEDKRKADEIMFMGNIHEKELKALMMRHEEWIQKGSERASIKPDPKKLKQEGEALSVVAIMLCSNLRNCRYYTSLLVALEMLSKFSVYFTENIKLHYVIPYLFSLFDEMNPLIVISAFNTACDMLSTIQEPIKHNSHRRLFDDYIKLALYKVYNFNNVLVKAAFVERLPQIIEIASVFIYESISFYHHNKNIIEEEKKDGEEADLDRGGDEEDENGQSPVKITKDIEQKIKEEANKEINKMKLEYSELLQDIFSARIIELTQAGLRMIPQLAKLIGPEPTAALIVPHTVSTLNTASTKLISLFAISDLVDSVSDSMVTTLLAPCLERCLIDSDERIVLQCIKVYGKLIKSRKLIVNPVYVLTSFVPLSIHPNIWIREEIIDLICSVIDQMDLSSLYQHFQPGLEQYVKKHEVNIFNQSLNLQNIALLNADLFKLVIADPLPRKIYEDIRQRKTLEKLINDPQMKDLAAMLFENFIQKIQENDEKSKAALGDSQIKIDPRNLVDLQEIINSFCMQTNQKHLPRVPSNMNTGLINIIVADEENKDKIPPLDSKDELRTAGQIRDLLNSLSYMIYEHLKNHHINFVTYIKNVHHFMIFANSILFRAHQIQKRREKDVGYHEVNLIVMLIVQRYERIMTVKSAWEPSGFLIKTIYEHKAAVNCLDASFNSKYFASASDDGEIKVFDISKIESDFTCSSLCTLRSQESIDDGDSTFLKVKSLKFLDENQFVFGTTTGKIELHRLEDINEKSAGKSQGKRSTSLRTFNVDGEIKALQSLTLGQQNEKCFMYVTHSGELGIQDLNEKTPSVKFQLGKERGMISTMLMSAMDYTVVIGTYGGYVMLYDIRANLLTNIYQLSNEAPILSLANHHPMNQGQPLSVQDTLIGISFGSDYHEVGFWNFYDFTRDAKNPDYYLFCSQNQSTEASTAFLKDSTKYESIFNIRNSFSERVYYDNLAIRSPIYNILNYFSDSIYPQQESQREKWLGGSRNLYNKVSKAFSYKNSAHKIVCAPNFATRDLKNKVIPPKDLQNIVFTAGNDLNLRYWNLTNSKCFHVHNSDGRRRNYKVTNTEMVLYTETVSPDADKSCFSTYQFKNGYSLAPITTEKHILCQAGHRDVINDILIMDKNECLVTCSRDKTIKVWR